MAEEIKVETTPQVPDYILRAEEAAKRLTEENKRNEELVVRMERLKGMELLGGKSEAGKKEVKAEETAKDYANRMLGR